jgi:catechol 2,3-dioxygenase-like lactoylglutathione lyase family enzyme
VWVAGNLVSLRRPGEWFTIIKSSPSLGEGTKMTRLTIGHVGLHVRDLEEEIAFLKLVGGEVTSTDRMKNGTRIAFVSLDGTRHHNIALFEDGEPLPSGDSKKEPRGVHHIAMPADSRETVDRYAETLRAHGIAIDGPYIQGAEGGGLKGGSSSYAIFFTDPNGVCFEIYAGALSVAEFRAAQARTAQGQVQPA